MSQFSASFHIRTTDQASLATRLRKAKFFGALFPPAPDWCAFVPFDEERVALEPLVKKTGHVVLHYAHAKDHGWQFSVAAPNGRTAAYSATWDADSGINVDSSTLDLALLAELMPPEGDSVDLYTLLASTPQSPEVMAAIPEKFARALGLSNFEWMSPSYLVKDIRSGSTPANILLIGKPPEAVEPPAPLLRGASGDSAPHSALEVAARLTPHFKSWDEDSQPDLILSSGDLALRETIGPCIADTGRLTAHGLWSCRFFCPNRSVVVFASLSATGILTTKSLQIDVNTRPYSQAKGLLDSTEVLPIAERIFQERRPQNSAPLFDRVVRLQPYDQRGELEWIVMYLCLGKGLPRWDLTVAVHSTSGEVLRVTAREA